MSNSLFLVYVGFGSIVAGAFLLTVILGNRKSLCPSIKPVESKGRIEGVAVYGDDNPAGDLLLLALPECFSSIPLDQVWWSPKLEELGYGMAQTGRDGRFVFSGLKSGWYIIINGEDTEYLPGPRPVFHTEDRGVRVVIEGD